MLKRVQHDKKFSHAEFSSESNSDNRKDLEVFKIQICHFEKDSRVKHGNDKYFTIF